jgi:hypothetical protein
MEGSKPIITGAQRELIEKHAAVLSEDGKAMIEDIEEEAKAPNTLPADVFKLIESCLYSLGQKAKKQSLSDGVIKQKEPDRLLQVEAIREHTTMLHDARLNGDRLTEESLRKATLKLVSEFMEAMDKDKDDGLDPDTARLWKEQVHEIVTRAKIDQPPESDKGKVAPTRSVGEIDGLAPLRSVIEQATYTVEAAAKEIQTPTKHFCGVSANN